MQILQPPAPTETLPILYRDEHFVVINKPSGLLVHRSMIDRHETRFALQILRNQLNTHVYPIHRLDKPTSGAIIFALSSQAARDLNALEQPLKKEYIAVSRGYAPEHIEVDHPLKEKLDKLSDKQARRDKPARSAQTSFSLMATVELDACIDTHPTSRYSLVLCRPTTGRKHQIRRHLKHISHPIVGDAKHGKGRHNRYFKEQLGADRLLLHASKLTFKHPYSQLDIEVVAPIDQCMEQLLSRFNWLDSISQQLLLPTNEKSHEAR